MAFGYLVDRDSIREHFPPNFPPPKLLREFSDWLDKCEGSIGCPKLWASRIVDWGEAEDMHQYLIPFIRTSCGSMVSFWFPDGKPIQHPPVVLVGSEGEQDLLGTSLEDFLVRLATQKTGDSDLDYRHDGERDEGPFLLKWLKKHSEIPPEPEKPLPNYQTWFENVLQQARDRIDQDPVMQKLGDELRKIAPPTADAEAWWSERFEVAIAGKSFIVQHGAELLPEAKAKPLEPLIRAERERRALKCPEHGASYSMSAHVMREGAATVQCEFLEEPLSLGKPSKIPAAEYRADLKLYPRTDYWMPAWLKAKMK